MSTGAWLKRVSADLGLLFLPVDTLLATGLIGHAALQVMTKTGARIGEVMQIRLTPEHLTQAELPGGKEVIAFWVKPKGHTAEQPYYIDGHCLKALHAWFTFLRERGSGPVAVLPPPHLRPKCELAPYLFQFRGQHFGNNALNACLRILLHGVEVSTAQGETVRLSAHLLRHGFATEMRRLPEGAVSAKTVLRSPECQALYAVAVGMTTERKGSSGRRTLRAELAAVADRVDGSDNGGRQLRPHPRPPPSCAARNASTGAASGSWRPWPSGSNAKSRRSGEPVQRKRCSAAIVPG